MKTRRTALKIRMVIVSLAINFLLSWTLLPVFIPPFRIYSINELGEVLLWQGIVTIGWPIAFLGGLFRILLQLNLDGLGTLLLILIYPGMLFLLIRVFRSSPLKRQELILLHFLLIFSFAAIWYQVLNGYDFMIG